jgi:serine-type D-Ala-D-Ala carboxypeptidase/endopeptidase
MVMQRILLIKVISLVAFVIFLPTQLVVAQTDVVDDKIKNILQDRIDRAKKSVGIVVGLVDDKGTRIVSYGKPSHASAQMVNGDSVFEIGSVSKVFTAILLADMVERGEVSLNDPISKYLPKSVKTPSHNGKEITLLHLTTHTSGLPRMPSNFTPKNDENPYADYSVEQMYSFLSQYRLQRDIGAKMEYSNYGVALLGHILALRAGTNYETLIRTRICAPLKMDNTSIKFSKEMLAHLAKGHNPDLNPVANWDLPTFAGAGGLRSTAKDLLQFVAANLGLVSSPLFAAMQKTHQPQYPADVPGEEIGLGWYIEKTFGTEIRYHIGETGGYYTYVGLDTKKRRGVVILSNSDNEIYDIGIHLLESQYLIPITLDSKRFDAYVGEYQLDLNPDFLLKFSREGAKCFVEITRQGKFEVFALAENVYFMRVLKTQASFTFIKDINGQVTQVVIHQDGADYPAKKVR